MTLLKKRALKNSINWQDTVRVGYNSLVIGSQEPVNYTPGRYIVAGYFYSSIGNYRGLSITGKNGIAVFDFNNVLNKFELTNFAEITDWWSYVLGGYGGIYAMVNNTTIIGIMQATVTAPAIQRCVININTAGYITFTTPYATIGNENTTSINFRGSASGHNGYLYYGYARGNDTQTYNGWINKCNSSTFTAMSGSINTGYTVSGGYQGVPGQYSCQLGHTSPNGYFIVNAETGSQFTCVHKIVNCNNTPVISTGSVSYAGYTNPQPYISLSATKVISQDMNAVLPNYKGRLALLYTNSATTPTSITKGAEAFMPDPPAGYGFSASDVEYRYFSTWSNASNYHSKENKILILGIYKLLPISTLANGDSNFYIYAPCVVESTSNTNLTVTVQTTDINGYPALFYFSGTSPQHANYGNYSMSVIGSPNNKATIISSRSDANGVITQQTFQL